MKMFGNLKDKIELKFSLKLINYKQQAMSWSMIDCFKLDIDCPFATCDY